MINVVVSIVQVITVRPWPWLKPSSLIQDAVDRHQTHQTYNKKEWSQLNLELNHLALYRELVWWVKNWIIHPPKAAFIAVIYCMHGQRDEKGLNLSPKRKNKFISVITKPSLNHDEVETSSIRNHVGEGTFRFNWYPTLIGRSGDNFRYILIAKRKSGAAKTVILAFSSADPWLSRVWYFVRYSFLAQIANWVKRNHLFLDLVRWRFRET